MTRAATLFEGPLRRIPAPVRPALLRWSQVNRLVQMFDDSVCSPAKLPLEALMDQLRVSCRIDPRDLDRIPRSGPTVAVANHPFGLLEGLVLASFMPKIRRDYKIVVNSLLAGLSDFQDRFIFVDPFGGLEATRRNLRAVRASLEFVRSGGLLILFPAGEVAHLDWMHRTVSDPPWHPTAARIARRAGAPVVPFYFGGANSLGFQLAGTVNPNLRTISLFRELLNKRGRTVEIRVGRPVPAQNLAAFADAERATAYLRYRTYLLEGRGVRQQHPAHFRLAFPHFRQSRPAPGDSEHKAPADVARLAPSAKLCEMGEFDVFLASADAIPHVLAEIGRLREGTFRSAGEGTGLLSDLDSFDAHYLHLFVWNRVARHVVGAYRLGPTPDILPRWGISGLYTNTLFRYRTDLFKKLGPAIELGRSFVRPEYQKHYAPLLLLWKGIAKYVAQRPECAVLFGCVSISREYSDASRALLAHYLSSQSLPDMAPLVRARHPYRFADSGRWKCELLHSFLRDIKELSDPIADLEADAKSVPVLVRQYLKLGGHVLGLNVDRRFSDVLDALIMVDMRQTARSVLERYMSPKIAEEFRRYHGIDDCECTLPAGNMGPSRPECALAAIQLCNSPRAR